MKALTTILTFCLIFPAVSGVAAEPVPPATSRDLVFVCRRQPAACRGKVFFVGEDPDRGMELWVTDGTPAGTRCVKDIWPGPRSSRPAGLTAIGGRLLFSAEGPHSFTDHGRHRQRLWMTDGSEAGTRLLDDVRPQSEFGIPLGPSPNLLELGPSAEFQGSLYFLAVADNNRESGLWKMDGELWKTDGTEQGTVPVTGFLQSPTAWFLTLPGRLLFATDFRGSLGITGIEAGSRQAKLLWAGGRGSNALDNPMWTVVGRDVYFIGEGVLWKL